jgi:hypothetical protein
MHMQVYTLLLLQTPSALNTTPHLTQLLQMSSARETAQPAGMVGLLLGCNC